MPSLSQLLDEVKAAGATHDLIRRKYLTELNDYTDRNVILYYSAWLQKARLRAAGVAGFEMNDGDMNGLMATIHRLPKEKGLDLILHTPGGGFAAAEALVTYLRSVFGMNIRAIVPQLAMSAGTMVALSCREILMGKHSSLGPIDPQIGGRPAHAIVAEFERAKSEIKTDPSSAALWHAIIGKYSPTLIGACEKAIELADEVVRDWLITGMFDGDDEAEAKADGVLDVLAKLDATKTHDRHISVARAQELNLKVAALEDEQALQERVLTVHHACMITLAQTDTAKLIENHLGVAQLESIELSVPA